MKVKTEVEYNVTAKAVLQDGRFSLVVSVAAPYGHTIKRKAAHVVNNFDATIEANVQQALQGAIESCLDEAISLAQARAQEAFLVAIKFGEEHQG